MPSTTTQRRLVSTFVEATNASRENAQQYLKNSNYDLNTALNRSVSPFPFSNIRISFPILAVPSLPSRPSLAPFFSAAALGTPNGTAYLTALSPHWSFPARSGSHPGDGKVVVSSGWQWIRRLVRPPPAPRGTAKAWARGCVCRGSVLEEEIGIATPCLI
ncbi:hypothetical protein B0T21DRAFT_179508 [Apiosordaria backusii]|uniref:Uncharacterized protein n=1 Tax=Apiosordaria backusii TaxID=314023 RepID=A0AA40EG71_9PEZI|nr:hypothetical protein B0T21DRAFT_179508 [Apiosordaria backusii]